MHLSSLRKRDLKMDSKKLEKLKQRVKKFREKHKNAQKQAKGVKHPNRSHKQAKAQAKKQVGPKGGVYTPTASGKKDYQKSLIKSKIKELIIEEQVKTFIEEVKMSKDIKKAVTAESAAGQVKTDDATVNGENKPSISDAKTQTQIQSEQKVESATVNNPDAAPAAPVKKEISFDGLFANDYALGAQLKQNPNGGNIMTNMKKPSMDYVERAKNHKNTSMTPEQFAQEQAKGNKK